MKGLRKKKNTDINFIKHYIMSKCDETCKHRDCCFLALICIPYDYKHYKKEEMKSHEEVN